MGIDTKISWARHTFNPWEGCTRKSRGCARCYMFRNLPRFNKDPTIVRRTSKQNWRLPLRLHKKLTGIEPLQERTVFMNSLGDFFHADADDWRQEIFTIWKQTPHLVYLVLTKHPERVMACLPKDWLSPQHPNGYPNVVIGTSIEDNKTLLERMPYLETIRAHAKMVSFEPLLERLNLDLYRRGNPLYVSSDTIHKPLPIDWAIIGGESGFMSGKFKARRCQLDWITGLAAELQAEKIPVFIKQLGRVLAHQYGLKGAGDQASEWQTLGLHLDQQPLQLI